ncbi:MAG: fumarate reductase subunit C [Acidobacteria bacterium]|nr:fumarate reductase subunit C [Acidobacteriota bacterium]
MKETHNYTLYHPKWYRERVSTYWWARQWSYFRFILRELSSIFVAYFVVLILFLLHALSQGPESYAAIQEWLRTPFAITLNFISLLFTLFHTITWFNLTPRAMPVRIGGKRLPDWMIAAPNYVAWVVISAIVAWFVIGG